MKKIFAKSVNFRENFSKIKIFENKQNFWKFLRKFQNLRVQAQLRPRLATDFEKWASKSR